MPFKVNYYVIGPPMSAARFARKARFRPSWWKRVERVEDVKQPVDPNSTMFCVTSDAEGDPDYADVIALARQHEGGDVMTEADLDEMIEDLRG